MDLPSSLCALILYIGLKSISANSPHEEVETQNTLARSSTLIINWMVRALNADWLTAVVYQTVYHGYDKTLIFYCSNYISNQFIIAIRHFWGLLYMANIPQLRAVSRHSVLRCE